MPTTFKLTEARAKFSEIIDRVSQGEEIIITRMRRPIARITRYEEEPTSHCRLGLFEGRINLTEGFDDWPADIARDLGIAE